ncbi:MAG TPA: PQQ-dependent sugar dehydrogenase [Gemmatimonadales bacterium]|nr:PQQ-dependent sugar dehydrogenase [Gemmatimonadales bacterium]
MNRSWVVFLGFAAAACGSGAEAPAQNPPPGLVAQAIAGHTLYVPPGFKVNLFAENQSGARYMALGPGNAVYLSSPGGGWVKRLVDVNHDGVADSAVTVLSGLSQPFGLAFRGDTLFVAEEDAVKKYPPGGGAPQTIVSGIPTGGHSTRTILFGPDGKLYLSVGSSCNVCDESDPRRAAVTQFNADGSGEHLFASGLRNSVGMAFNPTTGDLWAVNNDRDNVGGADVAMTDSAPPEHLNILKDGKWYGWPKCYLPNHPNPEYPSADCSGVEPPGALFQAHMAPLGLAFYTGSSFPAGYSGDAFVAFHGDWNRTQADGAKVMRVHVSNGVPVSSEDFVMGWLPPGATSLGPRWGRPVGLLVLPDGSLLISDDQGNRIWRVSYGK